MNILVGMRIPSDEGLLKVMAQSIFISKSIIHV